MTISPKRGEVSANPKNPYQKKLVFFDYFAEKGGGLGRVKKSLSEKTEVVKKGGGGGLSFLTESKKKQFFFEGSPKLDNCELKNSNVVYACARALADSNLAPDITADPWV